MLKLEDLKKDAQLRGIVPEDIVRIAQVEPHGEHALSVIYKDSQGRLGEQMLFRTDEARLELAQAGRPWAFDADGDQQEGPFYLRNPFSSEPDFGVASINYSLDELLARAVAADALA